MPFQIILFGPPASGKSNVITPTLNYLQLNAPKMFQIDEILKNNKNYNLEMSNLLKHLNADKSQINKLIHNENFIKEMNDIYFRNRSKIENYMNSKIKESIENNENILVETIGLNFPNNIKYISKKHDLYLVFTFKKFNDLIQGNQERSCNEIYDFIKYKSDAPHVYLSSITQLQKIQIKILLILFDLLMDCAKNNISKKFGKCRIIVFDSDDYKIILDSDQIPNNDNKWIYIYEQFRKILLKFYPF